MIKRAVGNDGPFFGHKAQDARHGGHKTRAQGARHKTQDTRHKVLGKSRCQAFNALSPVTFALHPFLFLEKFSLNLSMWNLSIN